ncbi:MAG TPA: L-histidine N(alpha)-methyltransferase [Candidatus Limnocylindrales bacterium]|nr:L-histidine N(alpha)-methyltransferase [Candidatus Limnocylindrales bacterium]
MQQTTLLQKPAAAAVFAGDPLLAELLRGLRARNKRLPPKYFYDARGSALFEEITRLPEYYLTRTERSIMNAHVGEMAAAVGARACMIEPGSGSGEKAEQLLAALEDPVAFVPVEVASAHLAASVRRLRQRFPQVEVLPVDADFMRRWILPRPRRTPERCFVFFPGSTIGNLAPADAARLLASLRRHASLALIGVDLRKPESVLVPAYDDSRGVTARFNLNMLRRLNREYGADFSLRRFRHRAHWDGASGRMRMFLESTCEQQVRVAGCSLSFERGELIHTEDSWKHTPERFAEIAGQGGWDVAKLWMDEREWFGVYLLRRGV